jgi:hypothetical protein
VRGQGGVWLAVPSPPPGREAAPKHAALRKPSLPDALTPVPLNPPSPARHPMASSQSRPPDARGQGARRASVGGVGRVLRGPGAVQLAARLRPASAILLLLNAGVPHPRPPRHPEKPTSEFGMESVPHTLDAVRVGQHFANKLVDAARCGAFASTGGGAAGAAPLEWPSRCRVWAAAGECLQVGCPARWVGGYKLFLPRPQTTSPPSPGTRTRLQAQQPPARVP